MYRYTHFLCLLAIAAAQPIIPLSLSNKNDRVDDKLEVGDARKLMEDISVGNDQGKCGAKVDFYLPRFDQSSPFPLYATPRSGSFFEVGTARVDVQPDTSQSFTVTVADQEPPKLVSQDTDYKLRKENGKVSSDVVKSGALIESTDNCQLEGDPQASGIPDFYTCEHLGSFHVDITQADKSGNIGRTTFQANVTDPNQVCYPYFTFPDVNETFHVTEEHFFEVVVKANPFKKGRGGSVYYSITGAKDADQFQVDQTTGRVQSLTAVDFDACSFNRCELEVTVTNTPGLTDVINFAFQVHEKPTFENMGDIETHADEGVCHKLPLYVYRVKSTDPGLTIDEDPPSGTFFEVGTTDVHITATTSDGFTFSDMFRVVVRKGDAFRECNEDDFGYRRLRGNVTTKE